jgi:uncharacterized repeat protein (TIGR03803 family)
MHPHPLSPNRKFSHFLTLTIALAILTLASSVAAQAQTEAVIYNFPSTGKAPHTPYAGLVFDSAGNLYGTTYLGGAHNFGTAFKLTPVSGGGWNETTIHSFSGSSDGGNPQAPLVIDSAGNLYGTTLDGGSSGQGTVFELSPTSAGGYRETLLHSFSLGTDGYNPTSGLVFDSAGNLYGNTGVTLFKLTPKSGGGWHYAVVHEFSSDTGGGEGTLIFDTAGNLYGTGGGGNTTACSPNGCGVVFKLSPTTGGAWHETILLTFDGADGEFPLAGLTFDSAGNLYGTTAEGGNLTDCSPPVGAGCGVVFKLSPETGGHWHESVLYAFTGASDGAHPAASVTLDASGNVYGTTEQGGGASGSCDPPGCGVVFELSPSGSSWTETVLHSFTGSSDGGLPAANLIFDSSGNLYSTTANGGANGEGTVFEITP